jgi:hypothetical protein
MADRSALHAQALTNIAMARERLDKLVVKADSVALDKELEAAMDAATKAVFGAETLRDMTATAYVQCAAGGCGGLLRGVWHCVVLCGVVCGPRFGFRRGMLWRIVWGDV